MKRFFKSLPERFDAAIAGSTGVLIVWLAVAVALSAVMFLGISLLFDFSIFGSSADEDVWSRMQGVIYHLFDLEDLYMRQSGAGIKLFTIAVTFVGMVLLNGMLITTISNIVSRRVADINEGRVRYRALADHYVIIGYSRTAICLIDDIFSRYDAHYRENDGRHSVRHLPKIVIMTGSDVAKVRSEIYSHTPLFVERRIFIYSGNIESMEHLERLNIHTAREVFVLGDVEQYGRDSKNLASLASLAVLRGAMARRKEGDVLRVNVQFDRMPSYSNIQMLAIPHEYLSYPGERCHNLYFRPFNFYENWARLLWSDYAMEGYAPLDFCPMVGARHVHLFIIGFNRMGLALLLESLRLCHYTNYDGTPETRTRITVVDRQMAELLPSFRARYPYIDEQIEDVQVEFVAADADDERVRAMLDEAARDENELLTVAVALHDPDTSLATALNLPEEVYRSESKVLVRQELQRGLGEVLDRDTARHRNVKVFGMLTAGVSGGLLDDERPIFINHNYEKMCRLDGFDAASTPYASDDERRKAHESWIALSESARWANRYQTDAFGGYKRALQHYRSTCGIATAQIPEPLYEALAEAEHRRWVAERTVAGWRAAREGEGRDNTFRVHDMIVPYAQLSDEERAKDRAVVGNVEHIERLFS